MKHAKSRPQRNSKKAMARTGGHGAARTMRQTTCAATTRACCASRDAQTSKSPQALPQLRTPKHDAQHAGGGNGATTKDAGGKSTTCPRTAAAWASAFLTALAAVGFKPALHRSLTTAPSDTVHGSWPGGGGTVPDPDGLNKVVAAEWMAPSSTPRAHSTSSSVTASKDPGGGGMGCKDQQVHTHMHTCTCARLQQARNKRLRSEQHGCTQGAKLETDKNNIAPAPVD